MISGRALDQKSNGERIDEIILDEISQLEEVDGLMQYHDADKTREIIKERTTPEKNAALLLHEEKLSSDAEMIEINLDLKFNMKPWKKALAFSFLFYLIVLFIFIVIVTFIIRDFDFGLISKISAAYLTALILSFHFMFKTFQEKFISLT